MIRLLLSYVIAIRFTNQFQMWCLCAPCDHDLSQRPYLYASFAKYWIRCCLLSIFNTISNKYSILCERLFIEYIHLRKIAIGWALHSLIRLKLLGECLLINIESLFYLHIFEAIRPIRIMNDCSECFECFDSSPNVIVW